MQVRGAVEMGDEPRRKEVVVPIAPPLLVGEIVQWLGEGEERITSSTFLDRLHQRELLPISELFWWCACDEHSGYCTPRLDLPWRPLLLTEDVRGRGDGAMAAGRGQRRGKEKEFRVDF